jgi:cation diffusion facilitator CzcD-associated flavoprotein CzcO
MPLELPKVAVIGAGSSGITALKGLVDRGFDAVCYEASDRVGGNWVFGNKNGMSASYRSLHINTSRERMEYSDFPMPKSYPDFPHHSHIAEYFDDYVDHFGIRDRIRAETRVERAERAGNGVWTITDIFSSGDPILDA